MTLHVETAGQGRDLVLLHGWGLHSGVWREALPPLAQRFRVHVVDLPGHGFSTSSPGVSFDSAAEEIAATVPDGAVLCGWSLGGLFAQRIARTAASALHGLVLMSTTPCFMKRSDWSHAMDARTIADFGLGLQDDRAATLARFVRLNTLNGARGREAARAFTELLQARPAPSRETLQASLRWLEDVDLRPHAPDIALRTLVLHGARDALAPIGAGRWLAASIPRATLVEWPDAAHIPFFTHREAFVDALERWIG